MSGPQSAWENHQWTSLPYLRGAVRADVCVVGLGGSGLAAIEALLDHKLTVVGIDAQQIAGGAAGANGGFLLAGTARFYHETRKQLGNERAKQLYKLTVDEINRIVLSMPNIARRTGSLRIALSDEERRDCDAQFDAMTLDSLPVERYQGSEGEGLLFPTDGVCNPLTRCRLLAQQVLQRGARLFESTPATEVKNDLVKTPQGHVRCSHVIVAVDGALENIFPELNGRIRTARLQMLGTAPTDEVHFIRPVYARYGYEYWQQLADKRIALGGFRDRFVEEEWTHSTETSTALQTDLENFLRNHLRVHASITHRWAASVGYTKNGMPIIDEVKPRVWAIGGYNGTGNIIGALCARAVAEIIATNNNSLAKQLSSGD